MKKSEMLQEYLENFSFNDDTIDSMFRYATEGGQKIRSQILLLSCEAVGGDPTKTLPAATAIELMHKFTLVHDDMVDKDELRRGKLSFHAKYSEDYAIFLGDFICSESFDLLKKLPKQDSDKALACYDILSDAFYKLCLGEVTDVHSPKFMTEGEYLELIYLKSAALIEAAGKMGALLGGGSGKESQMLADFGKNFALAMQILNDVKDTLETEKRKISKKSSDVQEGKWNILLINAFEKTSYYNKKELLRIMNKKVKTDKDVKTVQRMVRDTKSAGYARNLAKLHFDRARKEIGPLKESKAKESLLKLSDIDIDETYWKGK